jgi:hypothetical protein
MIVKDYADRTWCTKPTSQAWRDAQAKEFWATHNKDEVRVKISSAVPRTPTMFSRKWG